ncbi:NAD(P)-binding domain-containing protein [Paenibacillus sp. NPDC056579]|uniref:NAD(P)-binding domain-containing protein n=1 Tax=Paenibacillus sp. NPDC056579 TaxID=3345871 RepID=UPI0036B220C7
MTVVGIIGAGEVGSQIARPAIANGYEVVIANSREPETLKDLIDEAGDFVVVAVPLNWSTTCLWSSCENPWSRITKKSNRQ